MKILIITGHRSIFENCPERNISVFLKDQVSGTDEQSDSEVWFQQRLFASRCNVLTSLGEKISGNIDVRKSYDWIKNNFWFPSNMLIRYEIWYIK